VHDRRLVLRLALILALPESILLDRLRRLSKAELIVFRRRYGIRECRCKGLCAIRQDHERRTARLEVAQAAKSRRQAGQRRRELRGEPTSMHQSPCRRARVGRQSRPSLSWRTSFSRSCCCRRGRQHRVRPGSGHSIPPIPQPTVASPRARRIFLRFFFGRGCDWMRFGNEKQAQLTGFCASHTPPPGLRPVRCHFQSRN
jgi:hypothetical protein